MNKHLMKRSVTAALVAGGLVGLGAQPAQADGILFPYLSTQTGAFSFVSVVNTHAPGAAITQPLYQFTYGHKPATTPNPTMVSNTGNCAHFNAPVTATPSDMMTFHVGGTITTPGANGFALFEEGNDTLGFAPGQLTSQPAPLGVPGQLAFLAVEHGAASGGDALGGVTMSLFGWAEVIDTTTNLSFAYSTNHLGRTTGVQLTVNYALAGGIASGPVVLSWYPTQFVDTRWHVLNLVNTAATATMAGMAPSGGGSAQRSNYSVGVGGVGGAFNRDEIFFSGAREQRIRCFGIVTRADLLSGGPLAATVGGGWTQMIAGAAAAANPIVADDPAGAYAVPSNFLVHKIQTVTPATGLAPRQLMNLEPAVDPSYTP